MSFPPGQLRGALQEAGAYPPLWTPHGRVGRVNSKSMESCMAAKKCGHMVAARLCAGCPRIDTKKMCAVGANLTPRRRRVGEEQTSPVREWRTEAVGKGCQEWHHQQRQKARMTTARDAL